jgi:hypothetical protein
MTFAVQEDLPSQNRGIGTEAAIPEPMAEQHDPFFGWVVVAGKKCAAQRLGSLKGSHSPHYDSEKDRRPCIRS